MKDKQISVRLAAEDREAIERIKKMLAAEAPWREPTTVDAIHYALSCMAPHENGATSAPSLRVDEPSDTLILEAAIRDILAVCESLTDSDTELVSRAANDIRSALHVFMFGGVYGFHSDETNLSGLQDGHIPGSLGVAPIVCGACGAWLPHTDSGCLKCGDPQTPWEDVVDDNEAAQGERKRRDMRRLLTKKVLEQGGLCGERLEPEDDLHLDHIVPVSHGGSDDPGNLQAAHARCNLSKGARV